MELQPQSKSDSRVSILQWFSVIVVLVAATIAVYYDVSKALFGEDIFSKIIFENEWISVDYWSILHTIFFGMIPTFIWPSRWLLFFVFGSIWEIIEYALSKSLKNYTLAGVWEERVKNIVWDIFFNSVGLYLGIILARAVRGQKNIQDYRLLRIFIIESTWMMAIVFLVVAANFEDIPLTGCVLGGFVSIMVSIFRHLHPQVIRLLLKVHHPILRLLNGFWWDFIGPVLYKWVQNMTPVSANQQITVLDKMIPLVREMVIPYVGFFLVIPFVYASTKGGVRHASLTMANIIAFYPALFMFMVIPLGLDRSFDTGPGWQGEWLRWVHEIDQSHNTVPSLHATVTTTMMLGTDLSIVRYVLGPLILFSTVAVKQHSVLDAVTGIVLGIFSYWLARKLVLKEVEAMKKRK